MPGTVLDTGDLSGQGWYKMPAFLQVTLSGETESKQGREKKKKTLDDKGCKDPGWDPCDKKVPGV